MHIDGILMLGWCMQCLYGPGGKPRYNSPHGSSYGDSADTLLGAMDREWVNRQYETTTGSGQLQDISLHLRLAGGKRGRSVAASVSDGARPFWTSDRGKRGDGLGVKTLP